MEQVANNYLEISYDLYVPNEMGNWDLVERTTKDHPFQMVSGLGFALDAFEQRVAPLETGSEFDFTLSVEESYGEYLDERVVELARDIFCIDGKFDEAHIYPGNVIPLENEDGNRFEGIVKEVREDVVVVDLNHPLAGKRLHFRGRVLEAHKADDKELEKFVKRMSGDEECGECEGGGCGHCHCHHD